MRDRTRIALLAAALILLLAAFTITIPEPKWRFQTVDDNASEVFVDIAVDSAGTPHIVYMDEGGGVSYATRFSTGVRAVDTIIHDIFRGWRRKIVDAHSTRGNFMSLALVGGRPAVAYQDSAAGHSKVVYAERRGGRWQRETVDSITSGGSNVGMYIELSEFRDEPIVFYHRGGAERFTYARPKSGGWTRTDIGKGVGWYTGAASCNRQVFVGYGNRASDGLWLGTYHGEWRSRGLDGTTNTRIGMATVGCTPYMAYFDQERGVVRFVDITDDFNTTTIGPGRLSRVSLAAGEEFHVAYHDFDRGLVYAVSDGGSVWNRTVIAPLSRGLQYNGIAVGPSGTVHVAYTNTTSVVHATRDETVDDTYRLLRRVLIILALTMFLFVVQRERREEGKIYRRWRQNI